MQTTNGDAHEAAVGKCLEIFDAFFTHGFAFKDFRKIVLPQVSVQGALSKAETRERLRDRLLVLELDGVNRVLNTLRQNLENFVSFNSKVVYFLNYRPDEARSIVAGFEAALNEDNPFKHYRPQLPPSSDVESENYYPVAIGDEGYRKVLVFGVKRTVREIFDLPVTSLTEEYRERFRDLHQLKAHRLNEVSSYEVVVVNLTTGVCEVRISDSRKLSAASLSESATDFFKVIKRYSGTQRFVELSNFHPAIIPLYNQSDDNSQVTQFYFETDEDGVKRESVRFNRSDLRREQYHGAGSLAINYSFRVFAIRKHWGSENNSQPNNVGVVIEGSSRILGDPQPSILKAKVLNCCNRDGYDFVMSKITPHMV